MPGGKILSAAVFEADATVATGSSNGSLHVWRVERAPGAAAGAGAGGGAAGTPLDRYTGIVGVERLDMGECGAVTDLHAWGASLLVRSAVHGGVSGTDLRSNDTIWTIRGPPSKVGRRVPYATLNPILALPLFSPESGAKALHSPCSLTLKHLAVVLIPPPRMKPHPTCACCRRAWWNVLCVTPSPPTGS